MADWSRGTLEVLGACPSCGATGVATEYARRDELLAMPDVWRIVRCSGCDSLYLAERPDAESLSRAYEDYYTHVPEIDALASGDARGVLPALINGYLNKRFRMNRRPALGLGAWLFALVPPLRMKLNVYGRHIPKSLCSSRARLLDVGCGNGTFLLRAREMGMNAKGCEPDASASATCRELGLDVHQGEVFDAPFDDESFDVITLNHVIEHVRHPLRLLAKLHDLLVPGGILWLALPNPGAIGVSVFGKGWNGLSPPFHLLIPSQRILLKWLCDTGFSNVRLVRRGAQSSGMWRDSQALASREGVAPSHLAIVIARRVGDVLSTFSSAWAEETIAMAQKSGRSVM